MNRPATGLLAPMMLNRYACSVPVAAALWCGAAPRRCRWRPQRHANCHRAYTLASMDQLQREQSQEQPFYPHHGDDDEAGAGETVPSMASRRRQQLAEEGSPTDDVPRLVSAAAATSLQRHVPLCWRVPGLQAGALRLLDCACMRTRCIAYPMHHLPIRSSRAMCKERCWLRLG